MKRQGSKGMQNMATEETAWLTHPNPSPVTISPGYTQARLPDGKTEPSGAGAVCFFFYF
jgi:hypothetical protein